MPPKFEDRGLAAAFRIFLLIGVLFLAHHISRTLSFGLDRTRDLVIPLGFFALAAFMYGVDRHERDCADCQRDKRELEELDKHCSCCGHRLPEE